MIRRPLHNLRQNGHQRHSTGARSGFSQISSLDMLTCGLGAFLALCFISIGIRLPQRGLLPGVILTFEVESPPKSLIGVRAVTSDGIVWAGGGDGDRSIHFNPAHEGAGTINVVLTGDYQPGDRLYVFISDLGPDIPTWPGKSPDVEVKVNVAINEAAGPLLELNSSRMSAWISLDGIRQAKSLNWENDGTH